MAGREKSQQNQRESAPAAGNRAGRNPASGRPDDKQERLSAALRENLRRRKAQKAARDPQ